MDGIRQAIPLMRKVNEWPIDSFLSFERVFIQRRESMHCDDVVSEGEEEEEKKGEEGRYRREKGGITLYSVIHSAVLF